MKVEIRFPCGYEIIVKTNVFDMFNASIDCSPAYAICPLHGKKCKKESE